MKKRIGVVTFCGTLVLSQAPMAALKTDFYRYTDVQKHKYISKEVLVDLGLPANISFESVSGDQRILETGEKIEVTTHEETGLINFTTYDNYSFSVPLDSLQAPRNVSGETPF